MSLFWTYFKHAFSCHPHAKDYLKYEEGPDRTNVKSEIDIKEEILEPLYEGSQDPFAEDDSQYYSNWYEPEYEPEPEHFDIPSEPIKKKKGRAAKRKLEGKYFFMIYSYSHNKPIVCPFMKQNKVSLTE